ncbi:UNVERIFIED_CONTAM: hypothetical protein O8I53_11315 [Campylobacter lari]
MNNKNELEPVVDLIVNHLKENKKNKMTQSEVFDYLDKIKTDVPDEDMDDLLDLLIEKGVLDDESDFGDLDDVELSDIADEIGDDEDLDEEIDLDDEELSNDEPAPKIKNTKDQLDEDLDFDEYNSEELGLIKNYSDENDEDEHSYDYEDDYEDTSYDEDEEDEIIKPTKKNSKSEEELLELEDFSTEEIDLSGESSRVKRDDLRNKLTETNDIVK